MGFATYLIRRIANMAVLLLLVALFNYFLFRIMPGNVISLIVSPNLRPEARALLLARYNLENQNSFTSIYYYLVHTFSFDFGLSFLSNRPVWYEILLRLPATLYLLGLASFLSIILGVTTGIFAASRRGKKSDVSIVTSSIFLGSLPTFWIALLFLLVFAVYLSRIHSPYALPFGGIISPNLDNYSALQNNFWGFVRDSLQHLVLPLATLTIFLFGGYTLLMRNVFLGVLSEDYILTAKAKGVPNHDILYKHALGNAVLPLVTTIALQFGGILGGAVLTETVYNWNGLGRYTFYVVDRRDWPALQGLFFLLAVTTVLANFLADIVYAYLDPRVRL